MPKLYPRHVEPRLKEALKDSPVILIHGPRQCGKTTLAQKVGKAAGYTYISMDDAETLDYALNDPVGFVNSLPEKIILDEIQKSPKIFSQIKLAVDKNRVPGRFILTGSVSVLHVRGLSDSLAGRMEIIRMRPLAQTELKRRKPDFLDALFSAKFPTRWKTNQTELAGKIVSGGYPAPLRYSGKKRRIEWYKSYLTTIANTDAFTISRIRSVEDLPRLLELSAMSTAQLLNTNKLASSFQLSRTTIQDYISLLERLFLIEKIPAWHTNRRKRFVKTPKLHLTDTGLACALLGVDANELKKDRPLLGQLLETFVLQELQRQADGHKTKHQFFHCRDKDGTETDIVIQRSINSIAGVEVKSAATVSHSDFRGLRRLKSDMGKCFSGGTVLYNGEKMIGFGEKLYAVPIKRLWDKI